MSRRRLLVTAVTSVSSLALAGAGLAGPTWAAAGQDMTVKSVTVNGHAAAFTFVQPTYPGDPNGQNDPNPQAHEASQNNPVGGPENNPLPPACTPELPDTNAAANSLNGTQCPANKLVITPETPITDG